MKNKQEKEQGAGESAALQIDFTSTLMYNGNMSYTTDMYELGMPDHG